MTSALTFELRDLACCALWQTLVTGVAGQRHGNAAAPQQESNLLTAGILLDDTGGGAVKVFTLSSENNSLLETPADEGTTDFAARRLQLRHRCSVGGVGGGLFPLQRYSVCNRAGPTPTALQRPAAGSSSRVRREKTEQTCCSGRVTRLPVRRAEASCGQTGCGAGGQINSWDRVVTFLCSDQKTEVKWNAAGVWSSRVRADRHVAQAGLIRIMTSS